MKRIRFLGLLFCLIGLIGFGNCGYIVLGTNIVSSYTIGSSGSLNLVSGYCYDFGNGTCNAAAVITNGDEVINGVNQNYFTFCPNSNGYVYHNSSSSSCSVFYNDLVNSDYFTCSCPECPSCPSTGDILSGYIAISDITTNYCVSNDLCPESTGYSTLFINEIRHESMPFINITIPEEFDWDYNYTGNNTQFDLFINGYNTDSSYIEGIINTQNSKPNSTDFNNIISGLLPLLVPGLLIILFIYFIFKFIKKIF